MDIADLVQTGRALIRPLVRFFLVGAALFALERVAARPAPPAPREVLALPAGEIERRVREWTEETGGLPGEAERAALREAAIDEEVLFCTALRLRLHESDGVVSRRLVQNMRFLGESGASDMELRRQAFTLGMERTDLVVRRRLVERMEEWLRAAADRDSPDEGAVDAYIAAHPERFVPAARVEFTQLLLSRQRHGAGLESAALRRLADLRVREAAASEACTTGDPSLLPCDVGPATKRDVARFFGSELASELMRLPAGAWTGPLRSPYGLHLVWVRAVTPGQEPSESIRAAAHAALRRERAERALSDGRRALRRAFIFADGVLAESLP
jgi:hypothetical protein